MSADELARKRREASERVRQEYAEKERPPEDSDGAALLAWANARIGLPESQVIVGVVQRAREYDLRLADGTVVAIPSASVLMHPQKFEAEIAQASGHVIAENFTRADQKRIAQALLAVREIDETAGNEKDETREWVAQYIGGLWGGLDGMPVIDVEDMDARWELFERDGFDAFRTPDGALYLVRSSFHKYVLRTLRERNLSSQQIGARMGRLGFSRPRNREGKITALEPGGPRTRTLAFYASPPGFEPFHPEGDGS